MHGQQRQIPQRLDLGVQRRGEPDVAHDRETDAAHGQEPDTAHHQVIMALCVVLKTPSLKDVPALQWKNWDGVKVYTVLVRHVKWAEFERFPDNEKINTLKSSISTLQEENAPHAEFKLSKIK